MRISGTIWDRVLIVCITISIFFFPFLLTIPINKSNIFPIFLGIAAYVSFISLVTTIQFFYQKLKTLKIEDGTLVLAKRGVNLKDIISIQFIRGGKNYLDTVIFVINQDQEIKQVSVMNKPAFLQFLRTNKSKTLEMLYQTFPELKEKEVK